MLIGNPATSHPTFAIGRTSKSKFQTPATTVLMSAMPTFSCGICMKTYNMEVNLPKRLPCRHTACIFCLTVQETQSAPYSIIECPECFMQWSGVEVMELETNHEIVQVLEKISQSLLRDSIPSSAGSKLRPSLGANTYSNNNVNNVTQVFETLHIDAMNKSPRISG